jgi:hypothetical protein
MRNSTIALIGAVVLAICTIAAVVLLLLLGSDDVQSLTINALVAVGGTVGTGFLAWFGKRIFRDENNNGIPDDFEDETPTEGQGK